MGALFGHESIVVRLLLITVSGLVLYRWRGVHDTHSVVLFLLLIPTIYQFRGLERRMVADGFYYYSYVQSFWKDFDLRFENDYRKLGILHRSSLDHVTDTGHRRNIFSVGPAIFWTPFFLLGEVSGRVAAWSGVDVNLHGNGPFHWNAVAIGSLFYGFLAVLLIQSLLRARAKITTHSWTPIHPVWLRCSPPSAASLSSGGLGCVPASLPNVEECSYI